MEIKQVMPEDAGKLVGLIKEVETESRYMLYEAGERKTTKEQMHSRIVGMEKAGNSIIFAAHENDRFIGYIMAINSSARRQQHSVHLVIGILSTNRGKGVGNELFKTMEQWALGQSLHRLELTVVVNNEAGVGLYTKRGFEVEGRKRNSLFIDGEFVDEYYMAKLL
ncbi:GNAT family N-acetyltransferase [Halobacillus ihumii]|uniref:GNAT family N-acetyltransferase n=1 Tax=Halobacillus ihumii TaxID=2686092 RepID=UPI0013D3C217|nr:GNAT family N-acetyltransferase [Halobacillus ihumii]